MIGRRILSKLIPAATRSSFGLFALVFPSLLLAQSNPAVGTWKLDVTRSKYSTGTLPKNATLTVEAPADGVKTTLELVEPDGATTTYWYTANYDNKDYPISGTGGSSWRENLVSGAETISLRRENSKTFGAALKKSGNVVMTMRTVVSKDGKSMTVTANGADAKGLPTKYLRVWDKQ